MEESNFEREEKDGKEFIRINKIPLEELLNVLEGLYEAGSNFIDLEFFVDPKEVQSVIKINTRTEYMATEEELEEEKRIEKELEDFDEEDDEDEEDDILSQIRKQQEEPEADSLSEEDLDELI